MCHKGTSDPKSDVYVLKLGGKKPGIEVELRTPKCPDLEPRPKNTVAVQVIEDEFEDYKAVEVGKKGGDKSKGKDKKGKGKKGKGKKK